MRKLAIHVLLADLLLAGSPVAMAASDTGNHSGAVEGFCQWRMGRGQLPVYGSGFHRGALTAVNDIASTGLNRTVYVDVLKNDSIVSHGPVRVTVVSPGINGWATVKANAVLYYPKWNFRGTDSFTYRITDSSGAIAMAKATVMVGIEDSAGRRSAAGEFMGGDQAVKNPGWPGSVHAATCFRYGNSCKAERSSRPPGVALQRQI